MTLPGLLIEYLISGAMALIWLAPLLDIYGVDAVQTGLLPLLAIALYVVGMAIDFLAYWLVMPLKGRVRDRAWHKYGDGKSKTPPPESSIEREIKFALYAPEIAKEVEMRSSRDRIARGAIVNVLIALVLRIFADDYLATVPVWILISTLGLFIAIWWVFQYLSYGYEFKASAAVKERSKQAAMDK